MNLVYAGVRALLRVAVELYFVEIEATGEEHVPAEGPLIFAANHPNSIMDTFILGTRTQRQVRYMARSGLFRNPLVAALFHAGGVIPIYRREEGSQASVGGNEASFQAAYEVLAGGGCIGIFPEGRNSLERTVRPIKTGTARIALGAEARCGYRLGVKIVPWG